MFNTPSSRPSPSLSKRSGRTSTFVQRGIFATSTAVLGAMYLLSNDDQSAVQVAVAKAVSPTDNDYNPVSALSPENALSNPDGDAIVVQMVSFASAAPEKTVVQKGPRTIGQLSEGEIPHGTEIKLVDENGDVFIFATANNGDLLVVDGQAYEQCAIASKKTFVGSIPLGEHAITWECISKKVVDGKSMFEIKGRQKSAKEGEETSDDVSLRSEKDLATLARNVKANGQFEFALPKKSITGVGEVTLVGKIKKVDKK